MHATVTKIGLLLQPLTLFVTTKVLVAQGAGLNMEVWPPLFTGTGEPGTNQECVTFTVGLIAVPVAVATTPTPHPID